MPTKLRRHAITETPEVKAALDGVRAATGSERVVLAELVVLGAQEKLRRLGQPDEGTLRLRRQFAEKIRTRTLPPVDLDAAAEAKWSFLRKLPS